ncbi:hypothetical protein QR680_006612 [Steinernema hermaphroditum]|uniref:BUB1 N-terminal domain-containing protein n=1 Tax=Steinernema hermaphroditum TaxID=289476 RepID=A0AA39HW42_9BILA|nr:hypothetical protein QR680_006612 [Steinernema hermaphroditum]
MAGPGSQKYVFAVPSYFCFDNIDAHNETVGDGFFDQSLIGQSFMMDPIEEENVAPEDPTVEKKPEKLARSTFAKPEDKHSAAETRAPERKVLAPSAHRAPAPRSVVPPSAPTQTKPVAVPETQPPSAPRTTDPTKKRRSLADMFKLENFAVINPSQHTRGPSRARSPSPMRFAVPTNASMGGAAPTAAKRTSLSGAPTPPLPTRTSFGGAAADKPRLGATPPATRSSTASTRTSLSGSSTLKPSSNGPAVAPRTLTAPAKENVVHRPTARRSISTTSTAEPPKEEGVKKSLTRRSFNVRSSSATRTRGVSPGPSATSAQTTGGMELRRSERLKAMPKVLDSNKLKPVTTTAPKRWLLLTILRTRNERQIPAYRNPQLPSHLWQTYINFELRYEEVDRARRVWQQFLAVHSHDIRLWIRIAYEQAIEFFHDELDASILVAFALFEERQKEHERARMIYKYDLEHLPSDKTAEVYKHYRAHEKK